MMDKVRGNQSSKPISVKRDGDFLVVTTDIEKYAPRSQCKMEKSMRTGCIYLTLPDASFTLYVTPVPNSLVFHVDHDSWGDLIEDADDLKKSLLNMIYGE